MSIPRISVADLMQQKISEIQARLPVKMVVPVATQSFANVLSSVTEPDKTDTQVPIPAETLFNRTAANYPRLNADQLQALMPRIETALQAASTQTGMDVDLLRAMVKQESAFQPFATSSAGAMGLLQLMPGTADDLGVEDPYNIEENILGGASYLKTQYETFGQDINLALAAYNAGPNAVRKYDGIPPYQETQDFVRLVGQYYEDYRFDHITAPATIEDNQIVDPAESTNTLTNE